jgi:hypothetical protein
MALVGTISLTDDFQQIVPPDGNQHSGTIDWVIVLPESTVVADDSAGDNTATFTAATTLSVTGSNEALWAKGSGDVYVVGFARSS